MGVFIPSYSRGYAPRYSSKPRNKGYIAFTFKAEDVWSAAAAAVRINGEYLKQPKFEERFTDEGYAHLVQTKEANKVLVRKLLDANQGWTEEDVARGAEARAYWQAQMIKIIGDTATDFDRAAITAANKEEITNNYDLAVISSLVSSAKRGMDREALNDVKSAVPSKHQGKVGDHMVLRGVEVLACGGITDFGKYRIDAKFEDNLYTWWSGKTHTAGTKLNVKGRVKGHTVDRATNVAVTQLNYVKEI